jgi:outer membrane biosynthesis protein TonB
MDIYINNSEKINFYISGLFSISFTFSMIYLFLNYGYNTDLKMNIKIKPVEIDLVYKDGIETKKKEIVKKPTPKPNPIKKPTPEPEPKKEVTKPEPKPETPSLSSLFSNIKTAKVQDTIEETPPPPTVSKESLSRLKSMSKTESPVANDRNISIGKEAFTVERNFQYSKNSLSVEYEEMEIGKSSLDNLDQGVYDDFFSKVKESLYKRWHPSQEIAGNQGKVRIILDEKGQIASFKILIGGKSERFNFELDRYLSGIKGDKIVEGTGEHVSFEVFIGAKN